MPKVSVIVPNYNHASYLPKRLNSIFAQTFPDYEVILLDDCSTDDSRRVLRQYSGRPAARLVLNERNSGSAFKQWNKGASLARGEYLWFAESDDFAHPGFLSRLVAVLDAYPEVGLAYSQSFLVDEYDTIQYSCFHWTQDLDPVRWRQDFRNSGTDECRRFLAARCTIPNASAVLVRRTTFDKAGGAADALRVCGDWMTYVKLLQAGDLAYLAEPLNYYRWHSATVRARASRWADLTDAIQVVEFIQQRNGTDPKAVAAFCQTKAAESVRLLTNRTAFAHVPQFVRLAKRLHRLNHCFWGRFFRRLAVSLLIEMPTEFIRKAARIRS